MAAKKTVVAALLFSLAALNVSAFERESIEFIEYLLNLPGPGAPAVFEDAVIFTAPSVYKRVGVAFANEHFEKIHWFAKLLVPINDTAAFDPESKIPAEMLKDSGILFYAYTPETPVEHIEYRLIIDGLWSADPLNSKKKADKLTGIELSIAPAPPKSPLVTLTKGDIKELSLVYRAESGESITVAGDFNGWDPFMYQLKETSYGVYTISIPLPKGTWRYVFFHRGKRMLDPSNLDRIYAKNGMSANIIVLK
ncbi:MAG: isoamylase [Spirochaetaceae bacterium]|jgi:hypothetical protein|nr:isoamylase [Spirochaetaceae bacterium]